MNSLALSLVIAGALLHALWNVSAKKAAGGLPFVWLYGLVSLVACLPVGLAAWRAGAALPGLAGWAAIAGSALVHAVYSLVLQKGYQESDFTVVYPLARGTGPLFSVFGAMLVLGELPSPLGWLGIIAILAGILMISGNARLLAAPLPRLRAGLFWGVLTGLCIAAYTVIDGWAVKALAIQPVIYYVLSLVLRTALLTPQALRAPQRLRAQWRANARHVVVVGVLSPAAYTLVLFAMTMAPLSYVAPVRELSMLIGILFGARLLREAFSLLRVIGVAAMVAGVLMISFAG
ncbi:MAG TPA: DMT family transporter [Candidatus Desulfobacillus sp.]|nr:DMT family transporter [Candidatus Desulfobacillus sp.]